MNKMVKYSSAWKLCSRYHSLATLLPQTCVTKIRYYSVHVKNHTRANNIVLMGNPGSGKTTVGKLLAVRMDCPVIDIDNDYLENHWGMPVAQKLQQVGGNNFVKAEGEALLKFPFPKRRTVVSLTGSNPMYKSAMEHIKQLGIVIFLDVPSSDILGRLEKMKVNRIVGQSEGISMNDILHYRQQFYEGNYDIRIICEQNETDESITNKVQSALKRYSSEKGYVSTRQSDCEIYKTFSDVVLEGLATDGGLYVPNSTLPHLSVKQWERLITLSYAERAQRILEQWLHPLHVHPCNLAPMLGKVYTVENFETKKIFPVVSVEGNIYANELFYGPTASFKDAALQLLPKFFSHALKAKANKDRYLFLVATSGDTGSAVLSGFASLAHKSGVCRILVLYPEEGVSQVQKKQMKAAAGEGLHVVGVKSDFDFCQSAIKKIFNNTSITETLINEHGFKLSAANSINWGRLLPQIVYHASGYLDLVEQKVINMGDPVDLCVPTGNFGNILAAYYAKEMGIPYRRLICASNVNNVLTDFFNSGVYDLTHRRLHVTAAPAIDILRSSNLERYLYHVSGNDSTLVSSLYQDLSNKGKFTIPVQLLHRIQQDVIGDWCTEEQCSQEIRDTFQKTGYLLDPHTAVAKVVADRHKTKDSPLIIASTAHYAKFAPDVLASLNSCQDTQNNMSPEALFRELESHKPHPVMHKALKECIVKPLVHTTVCEPNVNEVVKEMYKFIKQSAV